MAYLTLQSQQLTPKWNYGGSVAYLYIWASQSFYEATTGEYIAQGQVNDLLSFCQKITCTVSGTTVTIPEVTLATTTDSNVSNVVYTAILATSANRLVYPLLENYFVDPEYFQEPAFAAVNVADAGTTEVDGVYTYRGQANGFPYYNKLGSADSTSISAIAQLGASWEMTNSLGATQYDTLNSTALPTDEAWRVGGGAGTLPAPLVTEDTSYIYGTWEQLTISNQGVSAVPIGWPGPFWNVQQVKEYVNSLVGDGTTPFASASVAGKVELDTNPVLPQEPIAVGVNSNRVEKNLSSDYGNSFATAITDIGSDDVTLIVKNAVTVSANTTLPANITLNIIDDGLITINANRTLTIGSMIPPPSRQVFSLAAGTSHVLFSERAVPSINIAWFASTANATQPINEALASCSANAGGSIYIPERTWTTTAEHVMTSNTTIFGDGRESVIQTLNTGQGIFVHEPGIYNVNMRDLTLDGDGLAIACYLCQGQNGDASAGQIQFTHVLFKDADYGFRIEDTLANAWQVATVSFDSQCVFRNTTNGIHCNSTNNVGFCEAFFELGALQQGAYFVYGGQWTFLNNEFAGTASSKAYQLESQTIVAAAGVTGNGVAQSVVTASGMVGSPKTVSVTVDTTMTTATLIATAFRAALGADPSVTSFFHIGGTGAEVQLIALDPAANDGTMNFTINTGTATGITNSATSTNTVAGVADVTQPFGVYLENEHGTINFIGVVEERLQAFLTNGWDSLNGIINFVGCSIQDPIKLDYTCSLNTTNCQIVDRTVRNAFGSASVYRSIGDVIPSTTFFNSATARTLSARTPHNFNGNTVTSGSCVAAVNINQSESRIEQQFTQRIFQNDTGFFDSRTEARLELMSSIDPSPGADFPMLKIGRCTATGEPLFYYDVYRDYATGFLNFTGNQTGFKAYVFDEVINVPSLIINGGTALTTTNRTGSGNLVLATSPTLTTPVLGTASATSIAIGGGTALASSNQTGSGSLVLATAPTVTSAVLVTPAIGVATGTSLTATGLIKSTGTAGIGYATGAGGTVTQLTSRTTGVTLDKTTGAITLFSAAGSATPFSFTVTNSTVAATDTIILNQKSGTDIYDTQVISAVGAGSFRVTLANSSGTTVETPVFSFAVIKGVTS